MVCTLLLSELNDVLCSKETLEGNTSGQLHFVLAIKDKTSC